MNARKANNTQDARASSKHSLRPAIDKVRQLQRKLYQSAKSNSKRKFHALFDKVHQKDILLEAWKRVRAKGGDGGIDRISINDVKISTITSKENVHFKREWQDETVGHTGDKRPDCTNGCIACNGICL